MKPINMSNVAHVANLEMGKRYYLVGKLRFKGKVLLTLKEAINREAILNLSKQESSIKVRYRTIPLTKVVQSYQINSGELSSDVLLTYRYVFANYRWYEIETQEEYDSIMAEAALNLL